MTANHRSDHAVRNLERLPVDRRGDGHDPADDGVLGGRARGAGFLHRHLRPPGPPGRPGQLHAGPSGLDALRDQDGDGDVSRRARSSPATACPQRLQAGLRPLSRFLLRQSRCSSRAEQIGYLINTAHHIDVGGAAPGSQTRAGHHRALPGGSAHPARPHHARRASSTRTCCGSSWATCACPRSCAATSPPSATPTSSAPSAWQKLYAEHGLELIEQAVDEILDRSEARMRELIRRHPRWPLQLRGLARRLCGTECAADQGGGRYRRWPASEITVDFSRSSDQVPVALNSYINYTRAYTLFAIKVFTDALLPQNGGMIRPIHVKAREGSLLQSARARLQRRPRHHPDPHLRRHQRRAGAGAARQGLRRLLALEQSEYRRRRTNGPASRSSCTT